MTESHLWIAPEKPELVWFGGADAERFLNDLISQEITGMEPGDTRRSLLLGPEGKLDHILWVLRGDSRFGLLTDEGRGDELASSLGRYRIRVDVDIESEVEPLWIVVGGRWSAGHDISWAGTERHLVIGDRPDLPEGPMHEYESLRIAAGEPRWSIDVDRSTIPEEAGLVQAAVDFDKGCYLGQELVARINSRGRNVPRHLRSLQLSKPVGVGASVVAEAKEVGTLTSSVDTRGLALLGRSVEPGDLVDVAGVPATVGDIPTKPQT